MNKDNVYEIGEFKICPMYYGQRIFQKVSYPIKVGLYSFIEWERFSFYFDLNHEIKFIHGKGDKWPHPNEFVKRTKTNDLVYYFSGEYYGGIFDATGEYYVPCFLYPSNSLWNKDITDIIEIAKSRWKELILKLKKISMKTCPAEVGDFIRDIIKKDNRYLKQRAKDLKNILGTEITVLPPDTRHVDYEVIPVIISDGCLYHCKFCRVKSKNAFTQRSKNEVLEQIKSLRSFYGKELKNYASLYLGLHDALNCSIDLIKFAIEKAWKILELENSYLKEKSIFLFGSVDSLLKSRDEVFDFFNSIPGTQTFINIGLESGCDNTLKSIGKPISSKKVYESFFKMMDINKKYLNIEITANFLFDLAFLDSHWESISTLTREVVKHPYHKGTIYLSPLKIEQKNKQLKKFMEIKRNSFLPMYLYIIQRF